MTKKTGLALFQGAIGIIESLGLVGSVEAADAMSKAAGVQVLGREEVGGGYFAVAVQGDVGAVRIALEAGAAACKHAGKLKGVLFIPRPHDALLPVFLPHFRHAGSQLSGSYYNAQHSWQNSAAPVPMPKNVAELVKLNVHQLRTVARNMPGLPLKGREISRANRGTLITLLREQLQDSDDHTAGGDA